MLGSGKIPHQRGVSLGWEAANLGDAAGPAEEAAPFWSSVSRCRAISDKAGPGSWCSAQAQARPVARPAGTAPRGRFREGFPGDRLLLTQDHKTRLEGAWGSAATVSSALSPAYRTTAFRSTGNRRSCAPAGRTGLAHHLPPTRGQIEPPPLLVQTDKMLVKM